MADKLQWIEMEKQEVKQNMKHSYEEEAREADKRFQIDRAAKNNDLNGPAPPLKSEKGGTRSVSSSTSPGRKK